MQWQLWTKSCPIKTFLVTEKVELSMQQDKLFLKLEWLRTKATNGWVEDVKASVAIRFLSISLLNAINSQTERHITHKLCWSVWDYFNSDYMWFNSFVCCYCHLKKNPRKLFVVSQTKKGGIDENGKKDETEKEKCYVMRMRQRSNGNETRRVSSCVRTRSVVCIENAPVDNQLKQPWDGMWEMVRWGHRVWNNRVNSQTSK